MLSINPIIDAAIEDQVPARYVPVQLRQRVPLPVYCSYNLVTPLIVPVALPIPVTLHCLALHFIGWAAW